MATTSIRDVAARARRLGRHRLERAEPTRQGRRRPRSHACVAAIDELGYVRNDAARQLRAGGQHDRSASSCSTCATRSSPTSPAAPRTRPPAPTSRPARQQRRELARERAYLDLFDEQRVHGVLISPFGDVAPRLRAAAFARHPGRARRPGERATDRSARSRSTTSQGGGLAVEHLLETGRRRIAFVGGPFEHPPGLRPSRGRPRRGRGDGVRRATLEDDRDRTRSRCCEGRRSASRSSPAPADERPDAVFAANDLRRHGRAAGAQHERADTSCPTRSRSSATTTSTSRRPPSCRSRRCASPAAHRRHRGADPARGGGGPRSHPAAGGVPARAGRAPLDGPDGHPAPRLTAPGRPHDDGTGPTAPRPIARGSGSVSRHA